LADAHYGRTDAHFVFVLLSLAIQRSRIRGIHLRDEPLQ
jgi:hypothetical protein